MDILDFYQNLVVLLSKHLNHETIDKLGISPRVSIKLSEIYAWTIDFFKIQEGDAFKVYYENNYIDGEYIGCLLYTSPSPRDNKASRMPSSA